MNFSLSVCEAQPIQDHDGRIQLDQLHESRFIHPAGNPRTGALPHLDRDSLLYHYLVALAGNSVLLYLISMERSLHRPMFFFLSMLAATDLILSNTCVPKTFQHLLAGSSEIKLSWMSYSDVFFTSFAMDSATLLAMAFGAILLLLPPKI